MIGWLELRELIDVYQRGVFSSRAIQKLLPPDYEPLLYRLQGTLRRCVSVAADVVAALAALAAFAEMILSLTFAGFCVETVKMVQINQKGEAKNQKGT